jgi:hypothetical protein
LFEKLYPIACECGADPVAYWDMTYGEIMAAIHAYEKRLKFEAEKMEGETRIRAAIAYRQADLTSRMVAQAFGSNSKLPTIYEAFPGIFPEESKPKQQNWQLMKARVEAYAAERRKRGEMKRGNDHRGTADPDHGQDGGAAERAE